MLTISELNYAASGARYSAVHAPHESTTNKQLRALTRQLESGNKKDAPRIKAAIRAIHKQERKR